MDGHTDRQIHLKVDHRHKNIEKETHGFEVESRLDPLHVLLFKNIQSTVQTVRRERGLGPSVHNKTTTTPQQQQQQQQQTNNNAISTHQHDL